MTTSPSPEDEKAAMEWLDQMADPNEDIPIANAVRHARTLKAMLAEPRLPAEPDEAMKRALMDRSELNICTGERRYRALHAHLTAPPEPKTRGVEVWRVEFAVKGTSRWFNGTSTYDTEAEAKSAARSMESRPQHACIRVTGPHKQEIPA